HARHVSDGDGSASAADRSRGTWAVRSAEGVRLGLGRADRCRVDLERCHRVPAPAVAERVADALADGRLCGDAVPRRLVPGGEDARAAELVRLCALADRTRHLPGRFDGLDDVLPDPGDRKSTRLNSSHVSISYAV